MKKRILLILILLVSSMSNLFAQFEVMTSEQAKKAFSEKLSLTSAEMDEAFLKYQIPFSNEMLQNGCDFFSYDDPIFRYNDVIGIKFYLSNADGIGVPCTNTTDSTLSFKKLLPGYYTITEKLFFTEQIQRKITELQNNYRLTSKKAEIQIDEFSSSQQVQDSILVRMSFEKYIKESIPKKEYYEEYVITQSKDYPRYPRRCLGVLVLTDANGNDFYVAATTYDEIRGDVNIESGEIYISQSLTTMTKISKYASSFLEKLEITLKNQDCYLSCDNNYFEYRISGDMKPAPDKNKLYKCDQLIMVDGRLYGIFTNDSSSYSIDLYKISLCGIEKNGEIDNGRYLGDYYSSNDNELYPPKLWDRHTSYVTMCDGYIRNNSNNIKITPVSFLEKAKQLAKEVHDPETIRIKEEQREKEYKQKIELERKANIEKYGSEFGSNINNNKVALGMTKEMCQKSWGYPSKRQTTVNQYGTLDVWEYFNAILTFIDGKLVQIDKW